VKKKIKFIDMILKLNSLFGFLMTFLKKLKYFVSVLLFFIIIFIYIGNEIKDYYQTKSFLETKKSLPLKGMIFFAEFIDIFNIILTNQHNKLQPAQGNKNKNLPKIKIFEKYLNNDKMIIISRYDGDLQKPIIELRKLNDLSLLHSYEIDFEEIVNEIELKNKSELKEFLIDNNKNKFRFFHPLILNDGGVITNLGYGPILKIDFCGNLEWINSDNRFHHSIMNYDQKLIVPSLLYPYSKITSEFINEFGFYEDAISILNYQGKIISEKSLIEIYLENDLLKTNKFFNTQDYFHLNDIEPAKFTSKYWEKGDLFLSSNHLNEIIQYRPTTNKIIRVIEGPFSLQHDVDIISNKEISIFNNNAFPKKNNYSNIIIYNFETNSFNKKFDKSLVKDNFKTYNEGLSEILDDGSLIVEETNFGRVIFYNNNGDKIWEYVNKDSNNEIFTFSWIRVIEQPEIIKSIKKKINDKECR
tara:strand:- start:2336 stop:3748 length:1413 start_codon:yes stop_codon:yes gene_type:complete